MTVKANKEKIESIFLQALCETFENLVFEETLIQGIVEGCQHISYNNSWWVKIDVLEPFISQLIMVIRKDLMVQYTEAIFGMLDDEMPNETQILDNLGELMNTFCGRVMALMLPPDRHYRLGLPIVGEGSLPISNEKVYTINCLIGDNLVFLIIPKDLYDYDSLS